MIQEPHYWLFLLGLVLAYWLVPLAMRTWLLATACTAYLFIAEPMTTGIMLAFAVAFYFGMLEKVPEKLRPAAGPVLIVCVLAYLGYFKYAPAVGAAFAGTLQTVDIVIPLGISYFTFKLIHYAIESGRGHLPEHSFQDFLSYVFLVPIFSAGPIERFDHFVNQRQTTWSNEFATEGLTRIGHGLIKKFVVGGFVFGLIERLTRGDGVVYLLENLEHVTPFHVGAFLVLTYLYVYMDFSGYTDIAIGASRLFGLRIMENFNLPIAASNIGNLWKRWHMTLAGWCQSYVYMPMMGWTRNPYMAVIASFLVMGLWHAATLNWIAWGLYNAIGVMTYQTWLVIERRRKWTFMKRKPLCYAGTPITFFYFAGSFAFTTTDRVSDLYGAIRLLAKCFFVNLPA